MELQEKLDLIFDVDAVLRGQGADAAILRARRPKLVEVAEKAMQESFSLLNPKVVYQEYKVEGVQHERLLLQGGGRIDSKLLAQQLATADRVIVVLTTIGMELEEQVSAIWDSDVVYALALDGAGSASVEALANAACLYFEQKAAKEEMQVSMPFSPGMVDWSVDDGQTQIFQLLGEAGSIVQLTNSSIMIPRKSLTMVLGIGTELKSSGRTCDFCTMRETCRYQEHYLE
jgi:hypothetical protein